MSEGGPSRAIEALLFLAPAPLSLVELCELTGHPPGSVQRALAGLVERYGPDSGLEISEVGGGHTMRTRADLVEVCDRLRDRPDEERISAAALETLAVIAYLGPIGRPEIGRLRGVSVDSTVNSLLERGLIEEVGRPAGGGAMRYGTTRVFEERFGLRHGGDLPPLDDFELSGEEAERVRRQLLDAGRLVAADEADTSLAPPDDAHE